MKIISAIYNTPDRDYAMLALNLEKSVKKLGYDFKVYRLMNDPMSRFVKKDNFFAPCFFKPSLIKTALLELKENILWLDSDCLMKERVDELLEGCDIAVTLRRWNELKIRNIYDGYINAGVMAFRYCNNTIEFIDRWISELDRSRADQDAMNRVLLNYTPLFQLGEIVDCDGVKIKIADCDTYNYFYFEDEAGMDKAKIYHIKGSLRPLYYNKVVDKVLGEEYILNH